MRTTAMLTVLLAMAAGAAHAEAVSGKTVYQSSCAMCHQAAGEGAAGLAPPLKNSQWEKLAREKAYLPGVLLAGMHGPIVTEQGPFNGVMPTQNRLGDEEIAAVGNYLVHELNGLKDAPAVTAADVAALRAKPASVAELRTLRKQALAR